MCQVCLGSLYFLLLLQLKPETLLRATLQLFIQSYIIISSILNKPLFFIFRKIVRAFTTILTLFVFFFFRKILKPSMSMKLVEGNNNLTRSKFLFFFSANDSSLKTTKNVFYFIDDNADIFATSLLISYCSFSSLILLSIVRISFYILSKRLLLKQKNKNKK